MEIYQVPIRKTVTDTISMQADSPHEAVQKVRASYPGWKLEHLSLPIEGTDADYECWDITGGCENCSKPILTGDKFYQWGGDDAIQTCEECGGAHVDHEPSIAE